MVIIILSTLKQGFLNNILNVHKKCINYMKIKTICGSKWEFILYPVFEKEGTVLEKLLIYIFLHVSNISSEL